MDSQRLKHLVDNLMWDRPEHIQAESAEKVIHMIKNHTLDWGCFSRLTNKFSHPNYCKIIKEVGYPENEDALPSVLALLQDANWPCFNDAISVFEGLGFEVITPIIEDAIARAFQERDDMWLEGLKTLVQQLGITFAEKGVNEMLNWTPEDTGIVYLEDTGVIHLTLREGDGSSVMVAHSVELRRRQKDMGSVPPSPSQEN